MSPAFTARHSVRSVFISDIHLGSRGCNATALLDFLRSVHCDTLYLVGDIVDLWSLRRSFYWPQEHNNVLRTLLGKAKHGTRVVYVPGNHDEDLREFIGSVFGQLEIVRDCVHTTADGKRLLVLHGDEFDSVVKCSPWLAKLGAQAYDFSIEMNRHFNRIRRAFGYEYWSLAGYLKHKVKNAVEYISSFERAVAAEARRRRLDGVVCGHIHRAEIAEIDGVMYCNDGDWVESCSAVIEDRNGRLGVWRWTEMRDAQNSHPSSAVPVRDVA
ncbi:MAG: UDP-2,3-diacylglucosamine diphosphatase [Steroidobacteraceae bacterium]